MEDCYRERSTSLQRHDRLAMTVKDMTVSREVWSAEGDGVMVEGDGSPGLFSRRQGA
jgi:hypothetical protein